MRILLIEDDEALRAVLIPVLEKAGFGCDEAADGASGLALLLQNPYDAAVVDRMLPALSGLELVRAARRKGCAVPPRNTRCSAGSPQSRSGSWFRLFRPRATGWP